MMVELNLIESNKFPILKVQVNVMITSFTMEIVLKKYKRWLLLQLQF